MTIRKAKQEDIPKLLDLLQQILTLHHQARPDIFKQTGTKYSSSELQNILSQEHTPIFVFEDEKGQVLGHLFCTIKDKTDNPVLQEIKTLFIKDLCVDQNARGQKIGDQLYQFALNYAKEIGCHNLTLSVWNDNKGALRFYQRQGMKPQETTMEMIID